MLAPVLLVARVEFDVAVAGSLVLEQPHAVIAPERHLLAVCLFSHHQFHLISFHSYYQSHFFFHNNDNNNNISIFHPFHYQFGLNIDDIR